MFDYGWTINCEICNKQIIHFSCCDGDLYDQYIRNNKEHLCEICSKAVADARDQQIYLKNINN